MSLYPRGRKESTFRRNKFEIVVTAAVILAILCLFLIVRSATSTTSDTELGSTLVEKMRLEEGFARESASQLSRIGGSTTIQLLATTRQHLYAMTQLNELAARLLNGRALIAQETLDAAISALNDCESHLLGGGTIDSQLSVLWAQIAEVQREVSNLS